MLQVSFICVILTFWVPAGNSDLYSAQIDIDNLFVLEKLVAEQLEAYLLREETRLQEFRNRFELSFGNLNLNSDSEVKDPNGDPIRNFVTVRRLMNDLGIIIGVAGDGQNYEKLQASLDKLRKSHKFPTEEDLTGTGQALTRAQETFKLEASDLANGFLAGSFRGSQLNVDDCFELGKQSYGSNEFAQSINWFMEALKRSGTLDSKSAHANDLSNNNIIPIPIRTPHQTVTTEEILQYLDWAQNINNTLLVAKEFLGGEKLNDFMDEFAKFYETAEGNPKVDEPFRNVKLKYEELCRKEIYNSNVFNMANSSTSTHQCHYHNGGGNPYFMLGPIKEEVLSTSPLVLIFHDVILDGEIKILQDLAKPIFQRSGVITSAGGTRVSKVRTGKTAWLKDDAHPMMETLNRRMAALTHFDLSTSEELQIVNYGSGGQYEPHFDFFYGSHEKAVQDDSGNRIATLLIYMSDVIAGGATVFPSLNISVQPTKGAGLFWYNLLDDGTGDYRTRHGACPVLVGSKWVANKWIHQRCNSRNYET